MCLLVLEPHYEVTFFTTSVSFILNYYTQIPDFLNFPIQKCGCMLHTHTHTHTHVIHKKTQHENSKTKEHKHDDALEFIMKSQNLFECERTSYHFEQLLLSYNKHSLTYKCLGAFTTRRCKTAHLLHHVSLSVLSACKNMRTA
jgi:hypothetical protein